MFLYECAYLSASVYECECLSVFMCKCECTHVCVSLCISMGTIGDYVYVYIYM